MAVLNQALIFLFHKLSFASCRRLFDGCSHQTLILPLLPKNANIWRKLSKEYVNAAAPFRQSALRT